MLHVVPRHDIKPHRLDTACPCGARIEWTDPETGEAHSEAIVIHAAYDAREVIEEAEAICCKGQF